MTFIAPTKPERLCAVGPGWRAEVFWPRIYLAVDPESSDDALPEAVDFLISKPRQRAWTCEWLCSEDDGWDLYILRLDGE